MKATDVSHLNQLQFTGRISFADAAAARTALRGDTIEVRTSPLERVNLRKAVAKPRAQRTWVKMFQRQFAPGITTGSKLTTIRPRPVQWIHCPKVGDTLDARIWLGKPYRSKQAQIANGLRTITVVELVEIHLEWMSRKNLDDSLIEHAHKAGPAARARLNSFAQSDGFSDWKDMVGWFSKQHGLPFTGILIGWAPLGREKCQ